MKAVRIILGWIVLAQIVALLVVAGLLLAIPASVTLFMLALLCLWDRLYGGFERERRVEDPTEHACAEEGARLVGRGPDMVGH